MIEVIQIYKYKEIFHKDSYTPENRKLLNAVESSFDSKNGYLDNDILYLPIECKNRPDLQTAQLIVIQDIKGWDPFLTNKELEHSGLPEWFIKSRRDFSIADNQTIFEFKQLSSPKSFEIFKISKSFNNSFDLFIDYDSNSTSIGIPKRNNHKICELRPGHPIRYKINGKSDFSMTGRKQRTFYEYDYIIELIGKVNRIEFLELNKISKTKKIPFEKCKLINERKILK